MPILYHPSAVFVSCDIARALQCVACLKRVTALRVGGALVKGECCPPLRGHKAAQTVAATKNERCQLAPAEEDSRSPSAPGG
jgi:hypothetical protein